MRKVKKSDLISDVLKRCPQAVEVFNEYELHCATCFMSQIETLEIGAKVHGLNDKEIEKMVKEINSKCRKKKYDTK